MWMPRKKRIATLPPGSGLGKVNLEIILIRHGETEYNLAGRVQGSLDSPLTVRGRSESASLGRSLATWMAPADLWLVSPQGRARESSRLIRENFHETVRGTPKEGALPPEQIEEQAREIHCGSYEGLTVDEMDPDVLASLRDSYDVPYPGGESLLDVMERGKPVRARILEQGQGFFAQQPKEVHSQEAIFRAVLVSHGNFIRCFCALLTELGPQLTLRSLQSNTGLNRLLSRDEGLSFKILTWNDISHTHGIAEG